MRDVIPRAVFESIQRHLRDGTARAEAGWDAGSEEEDTLTGDFGSCLRTQGWVRSFQDSEEWQWRVTYKKFRGRGKGALEKRIGADGIFQVEAQLSDGGQIVAKGVLFQAKKYKRSSRRNLSNQVSAMEEYAPGGSAVFEFGPDGYRAEVGRDVLGQSQPDDAQIPRPPQGLGAYLADSFLPCRSGLRGMHYDAVRNVLAIPMPSGELRLLRLRLRHRVTVEAKQSQ